MEALFLSTLIVTLAEMGDKTQLLSFVLAAKLKRKGPIILGIFFATLANHFAAGYVGAWLAGLVSPQTLKWIVAASFFAFGAWQGLCDCVRGTQALLQAGERVVGAREHGGIARWRWRAFGSWWRGGWRWRSGFRCG